MTIILHRSSLFRIIDKSKILFVGNRIREIERGKHMQLAIDGLIALVVVVSHLVILARMAYLDVLLTVTFLM